MPVRCNYPGLHQGSTVILCRGSYTFFYAAYTMDTAHESVIVFPLEQPETIYNLCLVMFTNYSIVNSFLVP